MDMTTADALAYTTGIDPTAVTTDAERALLQLASEARQLDGLLALLVELRDMARRDFETVRRSAVGEDAREYIEYREHWRTLRDLANLAHRTVGRPIPPAA